MDKKYTVNNVFDENGITLNDLITNLFITFLDEDLNVLEFNDISNEI